MAQSVSGKVCPKCRELMPEWPEYWQILEPVTVRNSLSRRDNKTYICNLCGGAEALADYAGIPDAEARSQVQPLPFGGNRG
jgi:hypothetical protein